jgi:hypothetical protein
MKEADGFLLGLVAVKMLSLAEGFFDSILLGLTVGFVLGLAEGSFDGNLPGLAHGPSEGRWLL